MVSEMTTVGNIKSKISDNTRARRRLSVAVMVGWGSIRRVAVRRSAIKILCTV